MRVMSRVCETFSIAIKGGRIKYERIISIYTGLYNNLGYKINPNA